MCRTASTVNVWHCTFRKATRRNEFHAKCCSCLYSRISCDTHTHIQYAAHTTTWRNSFHCIAAESLYRMVDGTIESDIVRRKKDNVWKLVLSIDWVQGKYIFRGDASQHGTCICWNQSATLITNKIESVFAVLLQIVESSSLAHTFAIIVDSKRIGSIVSCAFGDDDYGYCWHERSCAALVRHFWTPNGHQFSESKHIIW